MIDYEKGVLPVVLGFATSQTVASKLDKLLKGKGVPAQVEAVDIKSSSITSKIPDAYVSIVKTKDHIDIPTFNGIAFLTGMETRC